MFSTNLIITFLLNSILFEFSSPFSQCMSGKEGLFPQCMSGKEGVVPPYNTIITSITTTNTLYTSPFPFHKHFTQGRVPLDFSLNRSHLQFILLKGTSVQDFTLTDSCEAKCVCVCIKF